MSVSVLKHMPSLPSFSTGDLVRVRVENAKIDLFEILRAPRSGFPLSSARHLVLNKVLHDITKEDGRHLDVIVKSICSWARDISALAFVVRKTNAMDAARAVKDLFNPGTLRETLIKYAGDPLSSLGAKEIGELITQVSTPGLAGSEYETANSMAGWLVLAGFDGRGGPLTSEMNTGLAYLIYEKALLMLKAASEASIAQKEAPPPMHKDRNAAVEDAASKLNEIAGELFGLVMGSLHEMTDGMLKWLNAPWTQLITVGQERATLKQLTELLTQEMNEIFGAYNKSGPIYDGSCFDASFASISIRPDLILPPMRAIGNPVMTGPDMLYGDISYKITLSESLVTDWISAGWALSKYAGSLVHDYGKFLSAQPPSVGSYPLTPYKPGDLSFETAIRIAEPTNERFNYEVVDVRPWLANDEWQLRLMGLDQWRNYTEYDLLDHLKDAPLIPLMIKRETDKLRIPLRMEPTRIVPRFAKIDENYKRGSLDTKEVAQIMRRTVNENDRWSRAQRPDVANLNLRHFAEIFKFIGLTQITPKGGKGKGDIVFPLGGHYYHARRFDHRMLREERIFIGELAGGKQDLVLWPFKFMPDSTLITHRWQNIVAMIPASATEDEIPLVDWLTTEETGGLASLEIVGWDEVNVEFTDIITIPTSPIGEVIDFILGEDGRIIGTRHPNAIITFIS